MKKSVLIITIILSIISIAYGQDGYYSMIDGKGEDVTIDILGEKYIIKMTFKESAGFSSTILSFGTVLRQEAGIRFIDCFNGNEFFMEPLCEYAMIMKESFSSLFNKVFVFTPYSYHNGSDKQFEIINTSSSIDTSFIETYRHQRKQWKLKNGRYEYYHNKYPLKHLTNIVFTNDGLYSYYEHNRLISEGKLQREGNLIILNDKHLKHPLYVLVEKNGIVCLFPFNNIPNKTMRWVNRK